MIADRFRVHNSSVSGVSSSRRCVSTCAFSLSSLKTGAEFEFRAGKTFGVATQNRRAGTDQAHI
jgi:hypothetical protein